MKALVFCGAGEPKLEDRPKPAIQAATDAIVRITKTTICGTDLHILKGHVPSVAPGRILGHEGVGVVEQVGGSVANFCVGDRVLISCITSCGHCSNCKKGMYSHCLKEGGWILGNRIDGTQAEFVRIPFADNSLYPIPPSANDDSFVMLSDILPTGFEMGVINGGVKPLDLIAIVGCGPIGIAVLMTAQFYSPAEIIVIDIDDNRLAIATDNTSLSIQSDVASLQDLWQCDAGKGHESDPIERSMSDARHCDHLCFCDWLSRNALLSGWPSEHIENRRLTPSG